MGEKHKIFSSFLPLVLDFLPVVDILTNLASLMSLSFILLKKEKNMSISE